MVSAKSLLVLCAAIPSSSSVYKAKTYVEEVISDLKNVPRGYEHQIAAFAFDGTLINGEISRKLYQNNIAELFPKSLSHRDFIKAMSFGYKKLKPDVCFPKKLETEIDDNSKTFREFLEDMYNGVIESKDDEEKREWLERYFRLLEPKCKLENRCAIRISATMNAAVLVGLKVDKIKEMARELKDDIIPKQYELIEKLRMINVQVWVVTASPEIVVEAYLAERLPGVKVLGMKFYEENDVFKGHLYDDPAYGEGKVEAINVVFTARRRGDLVHGEGKLKAIRDVNELGYRVILAVGASDGDSKMLEFVQKNGGVSILVTDANTTLDDIVRICPSCEQAPIRGIEAGTSSGKSLRSLGLFDTKQ